MKKLILKILVFVSFFPALSQISADFNVNLSVGCSPLVVNFMDISNGGDSWTWDFGNGVTSNQQNPTYIYSQPGFYSVSLIIRDLSNNSDTIIKEALIRVNASPIADFKVDDSTGCSPHLAQFTDLSIPVSGTISDWYWSFENGDFSEEQHPTTSYTEIKNFGVFLKIKDVNGCEASTYKSDLIKLDGPEAKFEYDSVVCGLPAEVTFLNQSIGNDLEYYWDFGDGSSSTGDVPGKHIYNAFDSTEVKLIITEKNTGCSDTLAKSLVVGDYKAKFDWDIICGNDSFLIEVKNTTSIYSSLEWSFGNESTLFTQNASHQFTSPGPHEIKLLATVDPSCWDTTTISYTLPQTQFTYTSPICSDPFEVTFNNVSKGEQLSYYWEFGDSTFGTEINPIHIYDFPPERYRTQLFSEDKFGCIDSFKRDVFVPFPIARFYELDSVYGGCAPLNLNFADTSYTLNSEIYSVLWDFGDPISGNENSSTEKNPQHTYNVPGNYDITYTIYTNDGCADTAIFEEVIKVGEKPNNANFEQFSNSICYGETISFIQTENYLSPGIESNYFCWAFEEDTTPLLKHPESPPNECPKTTQNTNLNNPFINFSNPTHIYNEFTNIPIFGNQSSSSGEILASAGALSTHLIIGYNNCFTEVINPTFVDTTIAINGYVIPDSFIFFADTSVLLGFYQASMNYDSLAYSYVYSNSANDTLFEIKKTDTLFHELKEGRKYFIKTKVINTLSGCENEIIDVFSVDSLRLDFTLPNDVCKNTEVIFKDTSFSKLGTLSSREWLVNDEKVGGSYYIDSFVYAFKDTGEFKVTLRLKHRILFTKYGQNEYGYYENEISKFIRIEGTIAQGFSDTLNTCAGEPIFFIENSNSTSKIEKFYWDFGDSSNISSAQNINHTYFNAGSFYPKLNILDTYGCLDSLILPPIIINKPIANFEVSDTLICKGENIIIKHNSIGGALQFTWTIDSLIQEFPVIDQKFNSSGFFDIKLHVKDDLGCQDSIIKINIIEVSDYPVPAFEADQKYIQCPPLTTNFGDSSKTPVIGWNWNFGDGKSSTDQNPVHIYTQPGLYDVSLDVVNYAGCNDSLIKKEYIEIDGPKGTVTFNPDTICLPDSVVFNLDFEKTVYFVIGYDDESNVSYSYLDNPDTTIHFYKNGGLFQPKVELIDSTGCLFTVAELPKIKTDSIDAQFKTKSNIICDVLNIPFTNISRYTFDSQFTWIFGDGNFSNIKSPNHSYEKDSTYDVTLLQKSPLGCLDSITKTIKVFNAPLPELSLKNDNFCIPSKTTIKLNIGNGNFQADSIFLKLNDYSKIEGDSMLTTFYESGNQQIGYAIFYGSGNCIIDTIINKSYYKWPIAEFTFNPANNSLDEPVVLFKDESKNTTIWKWDFDDGGLSNDSNPGHLFNVDNIFNVSLIASNKGGCFDTIYHEVSISPYDFVKLPSAFSPNGDGQNETFKILNAGEIEILEFKIFNRWGNIVFETIDAEDSWDGNRKGEKQNTGTYIYYIKYNSSSNQLKEIKGNFTLLR